MSDKNYSDLRDLIERLEDIERQVVRLHIALVRTSCKYCEVLSNIDEEDAENEKD